MPWSTIQLANTYECGHVLWHPGFLSFFFFFLRSLQMLERDSSLGDSLDAMATPQTSVLGWDVISGWFFFSSSDNLILFRTKSPLRRKRTLTTLLLEGQSRPTVAFLMRRLCTQLILDWIGFFFFPVLHVIKAKMTWWGNLMQIKWFLSPWVHVYPSTCVPDGRHTKQTQLHQQNCSSSAFTSPSCKFSPFITRNSPWCTRHLVTAAYKHFAYSSLSRWQILNSDHRFVILILAPFATCPEVMGLWPGIVFW